MLLKKNQKGIKLFPCLNVSSYSHQIHIFILPISNKLQILLYNLTIILIKGILTLQSSDLGLEKGKWNIKLIKFAGWTERMMKKLIYFQTWSFSLLFILIISVRTQSVDKLNYTKRQTAFVWFHIIKMVFCFLKTWIEKSKYKKKMG